MSALWLLMILFLTDRAIGHEDHELTRDCIHSSFVEPKIDRMIEILESIPPETHQSANADFSPRYTQQNKNANKPKPLRIHMEYQLEGLSSEKAEFLKEKLMPAVQGVFKRTLRVINPVKGPLFLPWACISTFVGYPKFCHKVTYSCGDAKHNREFFGPSRICEQPFEDREYHILYYPYYLLGCKRTPHGQGVPNADFVLYVTAKNDDGCRHHIETVASAGMCCFDKHNWYGSLNRPLAGIANFCPNSIKTGNGTYGFMLDTAVHEVFHALLMSKQLFERFVEPAGAVRGGVLVSRSDHYAVRTPAVVKAAQEILGCSVVDAARLENEGGYGTANSHWERRFYMGEIMIGSSSVSSRGTISNLTLALAEDSGWYEPNYKVSGLLGSVEHRGCDFYSRDCHSYDASLEDTFCWNKEDASKQKAICTPDHTAVGYCKNDMGLIGACAIIQPFRNTQCTNSEHAQEIKHVDLGMRNKPGARCYPVASYKIARTESPYTVYRSGMGAVCFDSVCKEGKLHIRIPPTATHKERLIYCKTGTKVDLSLLDLGYEEGIIGPCPDNTFVCRAWGCLNDCNGNGQCFKGKCFCNVGFLGKSCEESACPRKACPSDEACDVESGQCFPKKWFTRPFELSPMLKEKMMAIHEKTSLTMKAKSPAGPHTKEETKAPTSTVRYPWELPSLLPSPSPKQKTAGKPLSHEKGVIYVPSAGSETSPSPSLPYREPYIEPPYHEPLTFEVPAYDDPDPSKVWKYSSGSALAVGLLSGCVLFEDEYNDFKLHKDITSAYTADHGRWALRPYPTHRMIIDIRLGTTCFDIFTRQRPVWRPRASPGMKTISAISTLVVIATQSKETNLRHLESTREVQKADELETNDHNRRQRARRYVINSWLLRSLGLRDDQILERDFIIEAYRTRDFEAKRAIVNNAIIANTITQCACYLDKRRRPSVHITDDLFLHLAKQFYTKTNIAEFTMPDAVYDLLTANGAPSTKSIIADFKLVARAISRTNKLAWELPYRYSRLPLLQEISRLSLAVETKFSQDIINFSTGLLDPGTYEQLTTVESLQKVIKSMIVPDLKSILDQHPNTVDNNLDIVKHQSQANLFSLYILGGSIIFVLGLCLYVLFRKPVIDKTPLLTTDE